VSSARRLDARTLEFYRQFGFADDVIAAGIKVVTAYVREARTNGSVESGFRAARTISSSTSLT
jgi:hypothetical protein